MKDLTKLSDLDLLVDHELVGIRLFGFDTYKHENRERASRLRKELDALHEETTRRGLREEKSGILTATGAALDHESDPRVKDLAEQNRRFIKASLS